MKKYVNKSTMLCKIGITTAIDLLDGIESVSSINKILNKEIDVLKLFSYHVYEMVNDLNMEDLQEFDEEFLDDDILKNTELFINTYNNYDFNYIEPLDCISMLDEIDNICSDILFTIKSIEEYSKEKHQINNYSGGFEDLAGCSSLHGLDIDDIVILSMIINNDEIDILNDVELSTLDEEIFINNILEFINRDFR